jgi:hypothetical protein
MTNSKVVAEQIGAQIFIDGWAMVAPGDPELAADLAWRAASVSHDGEAIYGAQVVAAMEALAFVEPDINKLLDCGVSFIPKDSVIYRMIHDIRGWHAGEKDWRKAREKIAAHYGYDKYSGNCHMVPNHGLIIHSLLYGKDDFQKSLMIVNTCGWDTDCNSGNVGCLLGIKNGLAGIEAGPDWRSPVADRMYLPTADGGRAITDAVTETYHLVNVGRALADQEPIALKEGARFHFELPGSVQGFQPEHSVEADQTVILENVAGHSTLGQRSLALRYSHIAPGRVARVSTATFIPPDAITMPGYTLLASPTLYPGQTVAAGIAADSNNPTPVRCCLYIKVYGANDELVLMHGPEIVVSPDGTHKFRWQIGDMDGAPIAAVGLEISSEKRADGIIYLDYLTWSGAPNVVLGRPSDGGTMWRRAWVDGVDHFGQLSSDSYRLCQDQGTGLIVQGTHDWRDYCVSAPITPHMTVRCGIGARVQGMKRYYGLLLCRDSMVRLVKALDGDRVLAETDFPWEFGNAYHLSLQVVGDRLQAWIGDRLLFDVQDPDDPLTDGGVALICEEGRMASDAVSVSPGG